VGSLPSHGQLGLGRNAKCMWTSTMSLSMSDGLLGLLSLDVQHVCRRYLCTHTEVAVWQGKLGTDLPIWSPGVPRNMITCHL